MRDAASRRHQPEFARPDQAVAAQAVAVVHLALEQPADRLQPGVRVRRHLHAGLAGDLVGAVVVDEAPGADHPPAHRRQQAPDDGALAERHGSRRQQLPDRARVGPPLTTCTAGSAAMLLTGPVRPGTDNPVLLMHAPCSARSPPSRRRRRRSRAARAPDRRRGTAADEVLTVMSDGVPVTVPEIDGGHGGRARPRLPHRAPGDRLHRDGHRPAGRTARRRVRPAGVPPPEPLRPSDKLLATAAEGVRRHRRRREARRGRHRLGARPAHLHQRLQRPDRRRRRHPAAR